MKKQLIAIAFAIVATLLIGATHTVGAQNNQSKDSIEVVGSEQAKPIFSGKEQNKIDSLVAVKNAFADPELKNLIANAIAEIKDKPSSGSPVTDYLGWIAAAFMAVVAVVSLFVKKWKSKPNVPASDGTGKSASDY